MLVSKDGLTLISENRVKEMMKTTIALFTLLSSVMVSDWAFAASEPELNCKDSAQVQSQQAMNICAAKAAKEADRELNRMYRLVRASYKKNPAQENRLVTAQLAWMKFRDAECNVSAGRFEGGTMAPFMYGRCLERLTKQRSQDLKAYLEEG